MSDLLNAPFDGSDYVPARDDVRLRGQIRRIHDLMIDGHWRTLRQIAVSTGAPEASVSAQLRHLKKEKFGSFRLDKENITAGLYRYRVLPPIPTRPQGELF